MPDEPVRRPAPVTFDDEPHRGTDGNPVSSAHEGGGKFIRGTAVQQSELGTGALISAAAAWELTTKRLRLVPCSEGHLDGLSAINSDPEVMRYITGRPETPAETLAMIERVKARWAKRGYSWWTFIERDSGDIVGAGCIQNLRKSGTEPDPRYPLEIAWRVRRDRWGRGLASEAAAAMAEFAFTQLGAESLYAVCHPENEASKAVMTRLGMQYRGFETWYAQTVAAYSMTAEAWQAPSRTKT